MILENNEYCIFILYINVNQQLNSIYFMTTIHLNVNIDVQLFIYYNYENDFRK